MRIVLTGTVCTGKSTVLKMLEQKGYNTVEEVARSLMKNLNVNPNDDLQTWQQIVEAKQIVNYEMNENAFFDRNIIDEIAFRKFRDMEVPLHLIQKAKEVEYDEVFFFDFWDEIYSNYYDGMGNTMSHDDAKELSNYLEKTYQSFGYVPMFMNNTEPEKRVEYILNNIT